jgi:hypothetical protein
MAADGGPWFGRRIDDELRLIRDYLQLGADINLKNAERVRALPRRAGARRHRGHPLRKARAGPARVLELRLGDADGQVRVQHRLASGVRHRRVGFGGHLGAVARLLELDDRGPFVVQARSFLGLVCELADHGNENGRCLPIGPNGLDRPIDLRAHVA